MADHVCVVGYKTVMYKTTLSCECVIIYLLNCSMCLFAFSRDYRGARIQQIRKIIIIVAHRTVRMYLFMLDYVPIWKCCCVHYNGKRWKIKCHRFSMAVDCGGKPLATLLLDRFYVCVCLPRIVYIKCICMI